MVTYMQQQIKQRLQELKAEYEAGQNMLSELETKQANLQQTLLRISGAIQVLEELLAADGSGPGAEEAEMWQRHSEPVNGNDVVAINGQEHVKFTRKRHLSR